MKNQQTFFKKIKSIFYKFEPSTPTVDKSVEKLSDVEIENTKFLLEIVINHVASMDDTSFNNKLDEEILDVARGNSIPSADFLERKGDVLIRAIFDIAYFHESFDVLGYMDSLDEEILNFAKSNNDLSNNSDFLKEKNTDLITIHHIRERLNYNNQAYKEFELLANSELLEAQEHLAIMYRIGSGFGIEPNREKAMYWYAESIRNGSISAIKDLEYMKNNPQEAMI